MATNDALVERVNNLVSRLDRLETEHDKEMERFRDGQTSERDKNEAAIRWIWRVLIGLASLQGIDFTQLIG